MTADLYDRLFDMVRRRLASERQSAPWPAASPADLERTLDLAIPAEGRPEAEVLERIEALLAHTPPTTGGRFFNQLFGGRIDAATAADMLVSLANHSMYTYKVAGAQILVERAVIGKMLGCIGFADGEGVFTPGGSISNLVAALVARNEAAPQARNRGLDGQRLTLYTSGQSHYSITKNAGMIGIGRENARVVPSDERGRMRVAALQRAIAADRDAGAEPFMINATAGTTVLGAFDPLEPIAEVARREGLWLHVDGAWGGALALHGKLRGLLGGAERADSFTWDAHKMMGTPLLASALLVRRKGLLEKHFSEHAGYLFQSAEEEGEYDLGQKSIQCGRRNDALKLWAAWQALGDAGYARRIERQRRLALYAAERIEAHPRLTLLMPPESMNVCFKAKGASSRAICERLNASGQAKISHGAFRGDDWIRIVTVNPEQTVADIDRLLAVVVEAATAGGGR